MSFPWLPMVRSRSCGDMHGLSENFTLQIGNIDEVKATL
jgi:hypothetical protein